MIHRGKQAFLALGGLALLLVLVVLDSARRQRTRDAEGAEVASVLGLLPSPDLAFASGARHLRHGSQAEPGAAFADGPEAPDTDPAGGAIAAPTSAWAEEAR